DRPPSSVERPSSVEPVETTAPDRPRRRYVDVLSQTTSPSTVAVARKSTALPFGCGRSGEVCTSSCNVSPTATGRCWVMLLARWIVPIAGKGNSGEVSRARCSGNASTCGYVNGAVSLTGKPHTAAYAATCSRVTLADRTSRSDEGS